MSSPARSAMAIPGQIIDQILGCGHCARLMSACGAKDLQITSLSAQLEEATAAHLATTELHKRQVQELAAAVNIERSSLLKELNRARADAFRMSAMLEGGVTPPRQSITDDLYMELQGARDQLVARARDLEGVQAALLVSDRAAEELRSQVRRLEAQLTLRDTAIQSLSPAEVYERMQAAEERGRAEGLSRAKRAEQRLEESSGREREARLRTIRAEEERDDAVRRLAELEREQRATLAALEKRREADGTSALEEERALLASERMGALQLEGLACEMEDALNRLCAAAAASASHWGSADSDGGVKSPRSAGVQDWTGPGDVEQIEVEATTDEAALMTCEVQGRALMDENRRLRRMLTTYVARQHDQRASSLSQLSPASAAPLHESSNSSMSIAITSTHRRFANKGAHSLPSPTSSSVSGPVRSVEEVQRSEFSVSAGNDSTAYPCEGGNGTEIISAESQDGAVVDAPGKHSVSNNGHVIIDPAGTEDSSQSPSRSGHTENLPPEPGLHERNDGAHALVSKEDVEVSNTESQETGCHGDASDTSSSLTSDCGDSAAVMAGQAEAFLDSDKTTGEVARRTTESVGKIAPHAAAAAAAGAAGKAEKTVRRRGRFTQEISAMAEQMAQGGSD